MPQSLTKSRQDKGCKLCRCECSHPPEKGKAHLCNFCIGSICVLIFPGGVIIGAFLSCIAKFCVFVPWLICAVAITIRRLGHKKFEKKVQVLDAGLGKTFRIVLAMVFFVVIPVSFLWLALGPLHLIMLLPANSQQRAVVFAVIMLVVVGECWKDGYKILKGKDD
jgi:hypothetical protein